MIFIFVYYYYILIDGVGPGDDLSNLLSMYNSNLSLYDEIKKHIVDRNSFSRPISIILNVIIHKYFGFNFIYYKITATLVWTGIIFFTYRSLNYFLNKDLCKIFLLLSFFPFFATTVFQSPYLLSAYQASILFWSISLYFS